MQKVLLTLFIFVLTFSMKGQSVSTDTTRKIEVTGSAEIEVVPDEVYVSFTLQEYYDKQKNKVDIDRIQRDFIDRCQKAGISKDRIMVQNMSGFDQNQWYWRKKKKEQPDMLASTTYTIKFSSPSDIDKLVNTLDDNSTSQMRISKISHSKIEDYRKDIKIKALQAAKAKAAYLCESIGEKVGSAIYIQEIDNNISPYPMYDRAMLSNMAMPADGANEGIDFQKIKIRYEMKAVFGVR